MTGRFVQARTTIHYFEREIPASNVYPCKLAEIEDRVRELPEADRDGIWAIGLAPSTRKDHSTNGRYFWGDKPRIEIYSWPNAELEFLLPRDFTIGGFKT